jgi:UDP-N-acetylmuramate dehydrogenase
MKDAFVSASGVDLITGDDAAVSPTFSYRSSGLPSGLLITSMELKGEMGDKAAIAAKTAELFKKKNAAQPVAERTIGSTFKNPSSAPAWKLIADAGLQGERVGGAEVSKLHANFIINTGGATSADIEDLAELIRSKVYTSTGIMLEYEMKVVGVRA